MRKLLMFVLLVLWSLPASEILSEAEVFAQDNQWSRTYGGSSEDRGYSVRQTTDGGYIVVGETYSFGAGGGDVYLIKTGSTGNTLWSRTYGGSLCIDHGHSVQQTTDGGYIVAGFTHSFAAGWSDVYLIKTDSLGDTLWSRTYVRGNESAEGNSVQQTTDGGYIVAGVAQSFDPGSEDVHLIKTDSAGDTLWSRTYGGSYGDYGYSVQQTKDGGYIVAGATESFGAGYEDVYLVKTDSTGDTLWTRTYGGSNMDRGKSVQQTKDGGYIVAGVTESFGAGYEDVYLIKTDSLGDTLWTRTYGGSEWDAGSSVQQTTDGGYIVAGWTGGNTYLIKTDSTGDALWSRTYGRGMWAGAKSVQQTTDRGYIVAGWTVGEGFFHVDLMLTKLDSLGNTCIGQFVSSTAMSVACTVTSPPTVINSPATIVTSPTETVTSPATEVTTVCPLVCGDCNLDGVTDIADVVCKINYIFLGASLPCPPEVVDHNGDGVVNIADVMAEINYLFLGMSLECPLLK